MALSKEMKRNIEEYGKKIKSLSSFVEAVRKMPGMYIGHIGNKGFLNMIREILQNSIDEIQRPDSPCDRLYLFYDERSHFVSVTDNGRGIPIDRLIDIFTKEHTSTNYEKKLYDYTSGVHGVGAKVTNALSDTFIVESYVLGKGSKMEFKDGFPTSNKPINIKVSPDAQGTKISFTPSYDILGQITLSGMEIVSLVKRMSPLTNLGSSMTVEVIDSSGRAYKQTFINEIGIVEELSWKTRKPMIEPVYSKIDTGRMKAEIAFTYDAKDIEMDEDLSLYGNMCYTVDGTHKEGFMDGMGQFFRNYMNNIYLPSNSKISVNLSDIRTGLKAVVAVSHIEPIFTGQAKEIFGNEEMKPFVKELTMKTLDEWVRRNPNDLQRLAKFLKEIAEIRAKSEKEKVKIQVKYEADLAGLPKKYERPTGNKDLELIIIEGDSAGGTVKNARDFKRQGIFPLRGKIPNAATTPVAKLMANQEITGMIKIINGGYGRNFDISKVKFDKIILMTDADPDGAHIRSKILVFFLMYMKDIITHGKLYKAIPPLYGAKIGKEFRYFTNDVDLSQYIEKEFSKNNTLYDMSGKKLTHSSVIDLLIRNEGYNDCITLLADNYGVTPEFLEFVLIHRNLSENKLRKELEKKYRFVDDVKVSKNGLYISVLANKYKQIIHLGNEFPKEKEAVLYYLEKANKSPYYVVNGLQVSLYELMNIFNKNKPVVQRYKGLGEMNADQLEVSTLHPDMNRTIVRYTVEDIYKEMETIKYLESNKDKIMSALDLKKMGDKI